MTASEGVWSGVRGNLDVTVFLDLNKEVCKARVIDRKVGRRLAW